jgi:hypothetical protein
VDGDGGTRTARTGRLGEGLDELLSLSDHEGSPLLPELRIATLTLDERLAKQRFVAVVNGIVGAMSHQNQELWVHDVLITVFDGFGSHRIHVVHDGSVVNFVTEDSQIAAVIASNDLVSDQFPLARAVELLVDPSVEAESSFTNVPIEAEISEPIFEAPQSSHPGIRPNPHLLASVPGPYR